MVDLGSSPFTDGDEAAVHGRPAATDDGLETSHETAAERDRAAEERDRRAELRDRLAAMQDELEAAAGSGDLADLRVLAESARKRAAADRARAAEDRARAADDRARAAAERRGAAERQAATQDVLRRAATDELTGAWTRRFGLEAVAREIERSHRTGSSLVLAFIDVDDLKSVNDRQGHAAGDRLLRSVVTILRSNIRPYDVIVRYGGDEFLCALPGMTLAGASERLGIITPTLGHTNAPSSISFGIAGLEPGERLEQLIDRADAALLEYRARSHGS